ncbi:carbohydrate ABC transporter membrane protein 1 (CUT1 family) [Aminobacter aminovorans]|uniref:Inner membrane ABC transporter permease protein ycjO n=1 Tax=Aminobacter aminovorans TaxID=83263 RepID=A0A381IIU8_AMIAI|nr:sugar ABC transporter permease [Aminobacter aminovorans]TCS24839.1 carbohydrate ABC transporter membrane protein 1 (CUT1 family) [Aminobacter aminovorans]SUY28146.1 Inner membrane ABC transporter permease protein ycjO [Aminobacter aminovorans]
MTTISQRAPSSEFRLLAVPLVLFLLVFLGFPAIFNLVYSVSEVSFETLRSPEISGFSNFAAVWNDSSFWQASWFSFRFGLLTAVLECSLGLFLAIFLSPLVERRSWLMAILMLPLMVAPALVGLMYRLVLHEFVGPVPYYLWTWFGASFSFLGPTSAFWTLTVVETLQWTPFAFLLFYMAYQAIPKEIVEASAMDGARYRHRLCYIELPLMAPTIVVALLIRFIDGFRVFDNVYVLTGSGPGGSTASLSIYIYEAFFKQGAIGKAVAASVILFVVSFAVLYGLNALAARRKGAR